MKWNLEMELSADLKPEMDMHKYFMMKALDEAISICDGRSPCRRSYS